ILNNSFEDWINFCFTNKSNFQLFHYMIGKENNRIWYKQWIKMNKYNKYKEYNSEVNFFYKFIKEWKKVGDNPFSNKTIECLNKNVKRNHLGNVKYLINQGIKPNKNTLNFAIKNNNQELIDLLLKNELVYPNIKNLYEASEIGNLELVKYLITKYN